MGNRFQLQILLMLSLLLVFVKESFGNHGCKPNGIEGFCIIANHFKSIVEKTQPTPYPQFKEFVKIFSNSSYPGDTVNSWPPGSIHTFQDFCELEYLKADFSGDGENPGEQSHPSKMNPYYLNVTEIIVDKHRMHNWLHFKIGFRDTGDVAKASGKIKYAIVVVTDGNSFPQGDFNHHLECGDCNCRLPKCYQATAKDSIPCMFTDKTVVSHPGQMMYYNAEGVKEIHATWHFAQHQNPQAFITELHFKALLIEDITDITMKSDRKNFGSSYTGERSGIFGWNPTYDILWPSIKTIGGWDYHRRNVYSHSSVLCHEPYDPENYETEPYPTLGPDKGTEELAEELKITEMFSWVKSGKETPTSMMGAREFTYKNLSLREPLLYYGLRPNGWGDLKHKNPISGTTEDKRHSVIKTNVREKLISLRPISSEKIFDADRCKCRTMPTSPPPENIPPPPIQVQGRKAHAVQMIIAWLCLVPFGIFVSRYYKETYSKVFFLQEYWWYTTHVLCLIAGAMFMAGGIYSLEIKRVEDVKWADNRIMAHNIMGSMALILFMFHLLLGHQRFKNPERRMTQIFAHWFFGILEYILAVGTIFMASFIVEGCMPCSAVIVLAIWIVIQLIIYFGMEVHMRRVDKKLNLEPKRSYLPPPIMRVFHKNAPDCKFRILILAFYGIGCLAVYTAVHLCIKFAEGGQSCFKSTPEGI